MWHIVFPHLIRYFTFQRTFFQFQICHLRDSNKRFLCIQSMVSDRPYAEHFCILDHLSVLLLFDWLLFFLTEECVPFSLILFLLILPPTCTTTGSVNPLPKWNTLLWPGSMFFLGMRKRRNMPLNKEQNLAFLMFIWASESYFFCVGVCAVLWEEGGWDALWCSGLLTTSFERGFHLLIYFLCSLFKLPI